MGEVAKCGGKTRLIRKDKKGFKPTANGLSIQNKILSDPGEWVEDGQPSPNPLEINRLRQKNTLPTREGGAQVFRHRRAPIKKCTFFQTFSRGQNLTLQQ
jgi:hypothetical protein